VAGRKGLTALLRARQCEGFCCLPRKCGRAAPRRPRGAGREARARSKATPSGRSGGEERQKNKQGGASTQAGRPKEREMAGGPCVKTVLSVVAVARWCTVMSRGAVVSSSRIREERGKKKKPTKDGVAERGAARGRVTRSRA
jgi:hypothetical protein